MITKFNTFKRLNEVYQEAGNSTFSQDSAVYDLNKLFAITDQYPVTQIAVAELAWILREAQPDPIRVNKANYTVPVLVTMWQGHAVVVDGLHRVAKAYRDGIVRIPCKMVPTPVLGQCLMPDNGTAAYVAPQEATGISADGMTTVTELPTTVAWPDSAPTLESMGDIVTVDVVVTLAEGADLQAAADELRMRGMQFQKVHPYGVITGVVPDHRLQDFELAGSKLELDRGVQLPPADSKVQ